MSDGDRSISSCGIVGRIQDTFETSVSQVSPFQIQVLLGEPQGLVADAVVAGVMPQGCRPEDGNVKVARTWIVLRQEARHRFSHQGALSLKSCVRIGLAAINGYDRG